jgi:hypothetical protein
MAKSTTTAIPADRLARYERLVAILPEVERKGATVPYTSCNGHMFSFLSQDGTLSLRLPPDELGAFLKTFKAQLSRQYGVVMKEYAVVPETLWRKPRQLHRLFAASYAYVTGLKPKATTRRGK